MAEPSSPPAGWEKASDPGGPTEFEERLREVQGEDVSSEEYARLLTLKQKKDDEYDTFISFWGTNIFYFGFTCSIVSLSNVVLGSLVVNIARTQCVQDLEGYVKGNIAMGYLWLIAFTWALIGPFPIHNVKVYWVFGGVWTFISLIINFIGMSFVSSASPCADTAPGLYSYAQWQVAQFVIAAFIAGWYIIGHYAAIHIKAYQKRKKAEAIARMDAEIAAEDAADEDDEDGVPEIGSPDTAATRDDDGDDDDADDGDSEHKDD